MSLNEIFMILIFKYITLLFNCFQEMQILFGIIPLRLVASHAIFGKPLCLIFSSVASGALHTGNRKIIVHVEFFLSLRMGPCCLFQQNCCGLTFYILSTLFQLNLYVMMYGQKWNTFGNCEDSKHK